MLVPAEVRKRGEKAVEGYIAALRKGKKKMPRCKLMILGEAGVGITNLLNLLTGEKFVSKHEVTEGIDIDLVSTNDISTETWKKSTVERYEEFTDVAADLVADELRNAAPTQKKKKRVHYATDGASLHNRLDELIRKYTTQPRVEFSFYQPPVPKVRKVKDFSQSVDSFQHASSQSAAPHITNPSQRKDEIHVKVANSQLPKAVPKLKSESSSVVNPQTSTFASGKGEPKTLKLEKLVQLPLPAPSKSADQENDHTENSNIIIIRRALKKSKQTESTQSPLPLKLTSFDFAGQKHYKPMHHCFITSRAIYVVAFNARQLLSGDQAVVNLSIQELQFWINSIRIHTNAKVVLVGTHKGPYDGASGDGLTEEEKNPFPQLSAKEIEDINNILKKYFDKDHCNLEPFKGNKIMALVESSIRRDDDTSGANVVRGTLKQLGDNHPGNNDDLPISYLRLEATITEKRINNGLLLIPHKEIEQCAKDCDIDECQVALDFFHDIGIIIEPSKYIIAYTTTEFLY